MTPLERIIVALVMALLTWLEKRHGQSKKPRAADRHPDPLARIGQRVRDWEDRARARRQPDPDRPGHDG